MLLSPGKYATAALNEPVVHLVIRVRPLPFSRVKLKNIFLGWEALKNRKEERILLTINSQSLKDPETLVPGTLHFFITNKITEDLPKLSPTPKTRSIQITFSQRWQGSGTDVKLEKMKHTWISM